MNSAWVTAASAVAGWFDAVVVRQTVRTSGINGIALTKLDVLDGLEEIKICVAYELDGKRIDYLPSSMGAQARVKPIYETLPGWSENNRRCAFVERSSRAGGQICPPYRRADRCAGGDALHKPPSARIRSS